MELQTTQLVGEHDERCGSYLDDRIASGCSDEAALFFRRLMC
jgi:hypothetical protein